MARRVDGASLALAIAGATTLAVALGSLWFTIGDTLLGPHPGEHRAVASWLHQVAAAIACIAVAAAGLGWAIRWHRLAALENPGVIAAGVLGGLVTLYIGFKLDVGPIGTVGADQPSFALRSALMLAGTLAVFVVVAGLALRRRRLELAALKPDA